MERRRLLALLAGVAGLSLIGYAVLSEASPEEQIREVLARFSGALAVEGEENPIAVAARINGELKDIVDPSVRVSVPELPGVKPGRKELVSAALQGRAYFRTASVTFSGLEFDIGERAARVDCIGQLIAVDRQGQARRESRGVHFELRLRDGSWFITSVTVEEKDGS